MLMGIFTKAAGQIMKETASALNGLLKATSIKAFIKMI